MRRESSEALRWWVPTGIALSLAFAWGVWTLRAPVPTPEVTRVSPGARAVAEDAGEAGRPEGPQLP